MIRYSEERGDRANANATRNGIDDLFSRELIFQIHRSYEILVFQRVKYLTPVLER